MKNSRRLFRVWKGMELPDNHILKNEKKSKIRNIQFKLNENSNKALEESKVEIKTGLKGFEPLTCGLRVRRYAELSYRPT